MKAKRSIKMGHVWKASLTALVLSVCASGCILGVAPKDAEIVKWQFVKTYINDDTRPLIGSIYQAQSSCRAYLEASKVGARRAGTWNTALLLISGIAALISSALSGLAGMKSASTQGGLSEAPEEGHKVEAIAHFAGEARTAKITAIVAALTTLVVGVTTLISNTVGPSKTREAFLTSINDFQSHLQQAETAIDQFNNLMSKSAVGDANNALRGALAELNKCEGTGQNLDVDDASIRSYERRAEAQYAKIVDAVTAANNIVAVATALKDMKAEAEFGPSEDPNQAPAASMGTANRAHSVVNDERTVTAPSPHAEAPKPAPPATAAAHTTAAQAQGAMGAAPPPPPPNTPVMTAESINKTAASIAGTLPPEAVEKRGQVLEKVADDIVHDRNEDAKKALKDNNIAYDVSPTGAPVLKPQ